MPKKNKFTFCVLLAFPLALALLATALSTWSTAHNLHGFTLASLVIYCFIIILLTDGIFPNAYFKKFVLTIYSSPETMNLNTLLSSYVYAWGAFCLLSIYKFSGLLWQHGIQYGIAAGIISVCLFLYWSITDWGLSALHMKRKLACLHGISLTIGLSYLILSGKLATVRGDWAANYVFLTGGITLLILCLVTLWKDKSLLSSKIDISHNSYR